MWRLNKVRHKAGRQGGSLEELRLKRRENERGADHEVVIRSLDIRFMIIVSSSVVAEEFVRQGGLSLLEALQYNGAAEMRQRLTYLLEKHLLLYAVGGQYAGSLNQPEGLLCSEGTAEDSNIFTNTCFVICFGRQSLQFSGPSSMEPASSLDSGDRHYLDF